MSTGFNLGRIIGALGLLVALAGCSAIKLGYNNFTEVAYWWLDGYVDFEDAQSPRVREDLARLHGWHRATELPRFADMLQRIERLAPQEVTPAQVCALVPELRERFQATSSQAEPVLVAHAIGFGPPQLEALQRKFTRNNRDYTKEWVRLSPADLVDKRAEQLLERMETMYGSLTEAQREALRQQLERSAFSPQRVLAERQRRQQDILQTLKKVSTPGLSPDEARAQLRALIDRVANPPDAAWRSYQEAMTQETCRLVADTHNSTSASQRERAVKRLRGYQRDLQDLAPPR